MSEHIPEKITVIIVGYNSEQWLEKCLSSLRTASDSVLQLCFVDNYNNASFDPTNQSDFDVEVLKTPAPTGFAAANNFGIQYTRFQSDFTVFLNQDTVSTKHWIDTCVECFSRDHTLGILSPSLRTYDLSAWEPNLVACVRDNRMDIDILQSTSDDPIKLRQVTAAAMVIKNAVLDDVGPFDPIFGSYYEDYDLCRRVRNAGYTIGICTAARVGHFTGSVTSTPEAELRRARTVIRNRLIHKIRENPRERLSVLVKHLCFTLPVSLIRGLMRTKSSQPISATLGAHWDLIKISDRLLSKQRDESCWQRFRRNFNTGITERVSS